MPRETYSTTTRNIAVDATAQARATALVADVQTAYSAYELARYGSNRAADVDEAYVRMAAIRIGLNRFPRTIAAGPHSPTAATFAYQEGTGIVSVSVDVEIGDLARAGEWARLLSIDDGDVLSAALCTGLGALAGDRAAGIQSPIPALGPFEPPMT